MDRDGLADFLRMRRKALTPGDVGLTVGPRRRAPGLRREEVAQLTGMSVDYYSRLEQRRGPQPSVSMLSALARTLRLSLDERDHLFRLAGHPAPERTAGSTFVRPALIHVLDQLDDCAAFVASDLEVVLAQNRLSILLMGDFRPFGTGIEASVAWKWFTEPDFHALYPPEEWERQARIRVANLRTTWSRRRGTPMLRRWSMVCSLAATTFGRYGSATRSECRRKTTRRWCIPGSGRFQSTARSSPPPTATSG